MKYRLAALVFFVSFTLVSCSLSEDITPPPGYKSPTPALAVATASPTPPAIASSVPTETPEIFTAPAQPVTQTPGAGTAGPISSNTVTGKIINGSGGEIPSSMMVTLYGFDKDQTGSYQKVLQASTSIDPQGAYRFEEIEISVGRAFLIITSLGGVEYQSTPVVISSPTANLDIPITIYDKTEDSSGLSFNQIHLIFDLSAQNQLQVTELFITANPGKQALVVQSDGSTIPFIHIPDQASGLQYQLSQGSSPLMNATGGFAMLPGADKQYAFLAAYTLPYKGSLKFDQPFSLPVSSLTVFIPQGMRLRGKQLTSAGSQAIQGKNYQMYQANKMASGSSLSLTLSGRPGTSSSFPFDRQTLILIGIAVVGILLIGLGIFLFLRDRARWKKENAPVVEQAEARTDALGADRDSLMDAMIALDDRYRAGEIPKEAYDQRRAELKDRLKALLS